MQSMAQQIYPHFSMAGAKNLFQKSLFLPEDLWHI